MNVHQISLEKRRYFSSEYVYIAVCSCGGYRSGKNTSPGDAERAGLAHAAAKNQLASPGTPG
jgi:hypothetical protein